MMIKTLRQQHLIAHSHRHSSFSPPNWLPFPSLLLPLPSMFHHQSFHPNSNMYTHTLYKISVFVICLSLQQFQFAIGEDCSEERTKDAAMESMGCKRPSKENAADASKASEINKKLGNVRGRAKCAASRSDSQRLSSAEKKRRQKFLDKLQCLRNMVPSGNKEKKSRTDELDDTILYLKYLENQYLLMLAEPGSPNPSNLVTKPKKFIANKKSGASSSNQCVRSNCKFCPSSATDNRAVTIAPQVAAGGSSTSALTIPAEQYLHGPSSFAQLLPITYDPKTLSILHQSVSRR